jgi:superfamily II DNA/RNA helicase
MTQVTSAGAEAGLEVPVLESSSSEISDTAAPAARETAPVGRAFADLGLSDEVLKAVAQSGYTTPTPIQAKGIPQVLMGRDVIGIAQTGTGKTASFTLPMIEILARGRAKARMPRSLILEPTRELAAQVAESFERYGKYNKLSMALLIGGVSFEDQDRKLDRGVDVLIATPGRLLDHFERGKLMLTGVNVFVIDEADRMLDMGFIPDVERICKLLPFTRQTLFYSATMPPEITRLTQQFLHNPARVEVARPATTAANIVQEIIEVPANDWAKRETLRRLVRENDVKNAIVFCNRKRDVDVVAKSLQKHGFSAAPLHGDLDQSVRTKTLDQFRNGEVQLLVASDVAARGLDIPAVSHIFNFDAPYHPDDYVHRIGRTGRAGRSGHAFMLMTPRDDKYVDAIERLIGNKLQRRKIEGVEPREDLRPRNPERDRGRGGRDRGRGRGRARPIKDHGQRASMEPTKAAPQAGAEQPQAEKPKREPRARKPKAKSESKPAANKAQQPRPKHLEHATADAHQLPAFLLRPVALPKAKSEGAEAAAKPSKPRAHKKKDASEATET